MEKQSPFNLKVEPWRGFLALMISLIVVKTEYNVNVDPKHLVWIVPMIAYVWTYHPIFISIKIENRKLKFSFKRGWD